MYGIRTSIWDQCLKVVGNTLRPTEVHGTGQLESLRPIILEKEDPFHLAYGTYWHLFFINTNSNNECTLLSYLLRCSQNLANLEYGVYFTRTWKKRLEGVELRHDAANSPLVYGRTVGCRSEQHLRSSVPSQNRWWLTSLMCLKWYIFLHSAEQ